MRSRKFLRLRGAVCHNLSSRFPLAATRQRPNAEREQCARANCQPEFNRNGHPPLFDKNTGETVRFLNRFKCF